MAKAQLRLDAGDMQRDCICPLDGPPHLGRLNRQVNARAFMGLLLQGAQRLCQNLLIGL